ncbi:MAG TPA: condensation domain-containing protein, partial [Paraburkholderia sp.]|nr:condensation domain-containing protein [Paraburkholderia sp.]
MFRKAFFKLDQSVTGDLVVISELLKKSADAGVFLSYENNELRFSLAVESFPEDIKREIIAHKPALIDFLKQRKLVASGGMHRPPLSIADRKGPLHLSFAQQRLWFIDQLGGSAHYNMPGAWRIQGIFDEQVAERALERIIERHEPLRTVFADGGQGPQQHIRNHVAFALTRLDLQGMAPEVQSKAVQEAIDAEVLAPFDLSTDL